MENIQKVIGMKLGIEKCAVLIIKKESSFLTTQE